ncbi:MAG: c-type cytochrome, partial [Verrucomicrobiota bacterium]
MKTDVSKKVGWPSSLSRDGLKAHPTILFLVGVVICCQSAVAAPMIPGLVSGSLDDRLKGLVLFDELNCTACHEAPASGRKAPRLAQAGGRLNPAYVERFIADPHGVKPGTLMPDVMGPQQVS